MNIFKRKEKIVVEAIEEIKNMQTLITLDLLHSNIVSIEYTSSCYTTNKAVAAYIGCFASNCDIFLFEVDNKNMTIRRSIINPSALPAPMVNRARRQRTQAFNQVKVWVRPSYRRPGIHERDTNFWVNS